MRTSSWHSSAYKFVGMYVWCMYLCWVRVRELLNQSIQQFLITFRLFCCKSKGMSISCYRSFDSSRRGQTLSLSHTHILFLWYFGHPQWIHLESTQPFWLHNIEIEKSMHRTDFSGAFGRWILRILCMHQHACDIFCFIVFVVCIRICIFIISFDLVFCSCVYSTVLCIIVFINIHI